MKDFVKVINPTNSYGENDDDKSKFQNYIKIKFKDNVLSITGVMGPMKNGDCKGSAGQCIDTICDIHDRYYITEINDGFTELSLNKFVKIWEEWHLNNAKPYDKKMKKLGWDKLAKKEIYEVEFDLTHDIHEIIRSIESEMMENIKTSGKAQISKTEKMLLNLPLSLTKYFYSDKNITAPKYYKIATNIHTKNPDIKKTILGCVQPKGRMKRDKFAFGNDGHPDGLLGKLCEESGNCYGKSWYFHEVPEDVLEWLYNLPDSKKDPAWV